MGAGDGDHRAGARARRQVRRRAHMEALHRGQLAVLGLFRAAQPRDGVRRVPQSTRLQVTESNGKYPLGGVRFVPARRWRGMLRGSLATLAGVGARQACLACWPSQHAAQVNSSARCAGSFPSGLTSRRCEACAAKCPMCEAWRRPRWVVSIRFRYFFSLMLNHLRVMPRSTGLC